MQRKALQKIKCRYNGIQQHNQPGVYKMNKSEQKHVDIALAGAQYLAITVSQDHANDYLARALSIISRSTMRVKTRHELAALALQYNVLNNPEFIN